MKITKLVYIKRGNSRMLLGNENDMGWTRDIWEAKHFPTKSAALKFLAEVNDDKPYKGLDYSSDIKLVTYYNIVPE